MQKTSIRFFENIAVRAVWEEETSKWWFCAVDVAEALTKSKNPRSYWNKIKSRKQELWTICRQLKLKAKDGKFYNTDVVDEKGLNTVIALINSGEFYKFSAVLIRSKILIIYFCLELAYLNAIFEPLLSIVHNAVIFYKNLK